MGLATMLFPIAKAGTGNQIVSLSDKTLASVIASSDSTARKDTAKQNQGSTTELKWYDMIAHIPGDWAQYANITFREQNIPFYLGVGTATTLLMLTDNQTYEPSKKLYANSTDARTISDIFVQLGDGSSQFALAGAFGIYGFMEHDEKSLRTGSEIAEAILAAGGVVQVLKHITGRESPFVSSSPTGLWRFFPNQLKYSKHVPHYDAFPSGHVCTSVVTVVVIQENYPEEKWISPVGYAITGLVGVGMVNYGIHWYSDYPLAIAIGYTFGKIISHPELVGQNDSHTSKSLSFFPFLSPHGSGATLDFVF
ncbi:MAG TPA: phosphatase PAP2 family protein [Bacteroidota bacterium]|nr:phosphatase PAP2 family protein [Bacteroidota bacterium]